MLLMAEEVVKGITVPFHAHGQFTWLIWHGSSASAVEQLALVKISAGKSMADAG